MNSTFTTGWLSLKQAADRLGIHPTTLRRWADDGDIPVMLTPGGHRRFAVADIDQFAEERRRLRMISGLEQLWAEQALNEARRAVVLHKDAHWLSAFSEEQREHKRKLGRRLMGIMMQYIALNEGGEDILSEARAIGREHAENAIAARMPLVDAIQAALFFRDAMVEVALQLPEIAHVRPEANLHLLRRINTLLNAVQLAIAEAYDKTSHYTRPTMSVICLGLSHHTATVELRERLSFPPAALSAALARFGCGRQSRPEGFSELAILSTCNRLELYSYTRRDSAAHIDRRQRLIDFLAETRSLPPTHFEPRTYCYEGHAAVHHLCRVAAGLDSLILGEPQILGQVAEAFQAAVRHDAAGPVLSALFRTAIHAGKRSRTETGISRNPANASAVAVRLAERVVSDLPDRHVLIIGAGEMGELAVEALRARGARQITVVNRTHERAHHLARRWGGVALSFEQLTPALQAADIVISTTGAPHTIIDGAMAREAMLRRADKPLILIDLAVPRDVDPAVRDIPGIHLYDLDQLQEYLQGAVAERQHEISHAEAIAAEEARAFAGWLRGVDMLPVIADLRARAEGIRQRELQRTLRHLPDLDPETRQHIEHLSESLVNKLLHEPTLFLRREAGNGHAVEYATMVRNLFGLSADSIAPAPPDEA